MQLFGHDGQKERLGFMQASQGIHDIIAPRKAFGLSQRLERFEIEEANYLPGRLCMGRQAAKIVRAPLMIPDAPIPKYVNECSCIVSRRLQGNHTSHRTAHNKHLAARGNCCEQRAKLKNANEGQKAILKRHQKSVMDLKRLIQLTLELNME